MGVLARSVDFLFGGPKVGGELGDRLARWQRLPKADLALPHAGTRYVVVDVETSGLDLRRDRLIAVGAIGLNRGVIVLDDGFDAVLRQRQASPDANILIHGIGGEAQLGGRDPAEGVVAFLEYAGRAPLCAYRSEFDQPMLERGVFEILGVHVRLPFVDLAFLLPALFKGTECDSLDDWLAHFAIATPSRHSAVADAYATAQLGLIALTAAEAVGMHTAADLLAMQKAQRWLGTRR